MKAELGQKEREAIAPSPVAPPANEKPPTASSANDQAAKHRRFQLLSSKSCSRCQYEWEKTRLRDKVNVQAMDRQNRLRTHQPCQVEAVTEQRKAAFLGAALSGTATESRKPCESRKRRKKRGVASPFPVTRFFEIARGRTLPTGGRDDGGSKI
jgi:hypothetical protein